MATELLHLHSQASVDDDSEDGHGKQSRRNPVSQHGYGRSIRREVNYVISQKTADSRLTVFDRAIKDFEDWKDLMVAHMTFF